MSELQTYRVAPVSDVPVQLSQRPTPPPFGIVAAKADVLVPTQKARSPFVPGPMAVVPVYTSIVVLSAESYPTQLVDSRFTPGRAERPEGIRFSAFTPSRELIEAFIEGTRVEGVDADHLDLPMPGGAAEQFVTAEEFYEQIAALIKRRVANYFAGLAYELRAKGYRSIRISGDSGRFVLFVANALAEQFPVGPYNIAKFLMALSSNLEGVLRQGRLVAKWGCLRSVPAGLLFDVTLPPLPAEFA